MKAGLALVVFGIGVSSALQEESSEFEIGVIDSPPHGISAIPHAAIVNFFRSDD